MKIYLLILCFLIAGPGLAKKKDLVKKVCNASEVDKDLIECAYSIKDSVKVVISGIGHKAPHKLIFEKVDKLSYYVVYSTVQKCLIMAEFKEGADFYSISPRTGRIYTEEFKCSQD